MGGSDGTSTQTVERQTIPPIIAGPLGRILGRAEHASNLVPQIPFEGPFFAGPTQNQLLALNQQQNLANSLIGSGFGSSGLDLAEAQLRGDFLFPQSNPFLLANIGTGIELINRNLFENQLPQIGSAAQQQGAFGGSRQGVIESQALRQANENASGLASDLLFRNFAQERAFQQQAPQFGQQAIQLAASPANLLAGVGDVQQQFAQQNIEERLAQFQEQIAAPFRGITPLVQVLQGISPLVSGAGTATGSAVSTRPTISPAVSGLSGALGGAASGAAIGAQIGSGYPGIGTIIGALAGLGVGLGTSL